jgi:uncharacterized membrane protein
VDPGPQVDIKFDFTLNIVRIPESRRSHLMPEEFPPQPPAYIPPPPAASSGLTDTAAAAIAYITIIPAIIFLVLEPYNRKPFIRFHSFQCLLLAAVSIVAHIAIMILGTVLHIIPFLGALMSGLLHLAVTLVVFVAWLMCIIKANKGEWYKLPVIGDIALKQANP